MKSLAEVDSGMSNDKKFAEQMGARRHEEG